MTKTPGSRSSLKSHSKAGSKTASKSRSKARATHSTPSAITKSLRTAQKAIAAYIKPGRRKAAATLDEIIAMLHDARISLAHQVGAAKAKSSVRAPVKRAAAVRKAHVKKSSPKKAGLKKSRAKATRKKVAHP